jgi:hypothetical protein
MGGRMHAKDHIHVASRKAIVANGKNASNPAKVLTDGSSEMCQEQ